MSGQGHGSRGDFPTRVSLLGLAETAHGKGAAGRETSGRDLEGVTVAMRTPTVLHQRSRAPHPLGVEMLQSEA